MRTEPHDRIVSDPAIMLGKPTIRGTRITVELILRKLGEGMAERELIEAYPHLAPGDIRAAPRFAVDYLTDEEIVFGDSEAAELAGAASLRAVMDVVGRRMGERGLTEAKLEDILNGA